MSASLVSFFKCQTARRLPADARHRPRFYGSRARHSHSRAFSHLPPRQIVVRLMPERAYGAQGVVAARSLDAHELHAHPRLKAPRCTVVFTPALRTRLGYAACSMSQGWPLALASPRSSELSPGHALGPSSVSPASHSCRRLGHTQSRKRQGHDVVRTNRIPHHVSKTIATHPLPARDKRMIFILG